MHEFSFSVGAVLAVIHDVLMTIGCYCLTGMFGEGRQFNATMVAAVLTIIGFSINDTIVIFDRIREDLKMGMRGSFKEVINQALNQTLSRTIITSGTVFLATMSLYLFGGGPINDFAFTFLVGIITGTYSSIYTASSALGPVVAQGRSSQDEQVPGDYGERLAFAVLTVRAMQASVEITHWHWVVFIACVGGVLALDLGLFHRNPRRLGFAEAMGWTLGWLAFAFAVCHGAGRSARTPGGFGVCCRLFSRTLLVAG